MSASSNDSSSGRAFKKRVNFFEERFLTEPGQSLESYSKLLSTWNDKLSATGFSDIEYVSKEGITSPFFRDYPTSSLAKNYSHQKESYYRLARLMYWHFPWQEKFPWRRFTVYKLIWGWHSEGLKLSEITEKLKKRWRKKKKDERGKYGTSIFWVHQALNTIRPMVFEYYNTNLDKFNDEFETLSDEIARKRGEK